MPQANVDTHPKPPPEPYRARLRPHKMRPNVQAPEQERLLHVALPIELLVKVIHHAVTVEHEFETCGFDARNYT